VPFLSVNKPETTTSTRTAYTPCAFFLALCVFLSSVWLVQNPCTRFNGTLLKGYRGCRGYLSSHQSKSATAYARKERKEKEKTPLVVMIHVQPA
jgi:hypothetical protein